MENLTSIQQQATLVWRHIRGFLLTRQIEPFKTKMVECAKSSQPFEEFNLFSKLDGVSKTQDQLIEILASIEEHGHSIRLDLQANEHGKIEAWWDGCYIGMVRNRHQEWLSPLVQDAVCEVSAITGGIDGKYFGCNIRLHNLHNAVTIFQENLF